MFDSDSDTEDNVPPQDDDEDNEDDDSTEGLEKLSASQIKKLKKVSCKIGYMYRSCSLNDALKRNLLRLNFISVYYKLSLTVLFYTFFFTLSN